MNAAVRALLQQELSITIKDIKAVGGGSINEAYRIQTTERRFFCKVNSATKFPHLFEKETAGLKALAQPQVIRTPTIEGLIETGHLQVLVLEWLDTEQPDTTCWATLGQQLAALHQCTQETFGFVTDNYMGAVPQINTSHADWPSFFIHNRLEPLVQECTALDLLPVQLAHLFQRFYDRIPQLFNPEPPALLHGDLWSGNFLCTHAQVPALIDPAVYYGHRSIDLAMTTLFGGFGAAFYEAYHYYYPLPSNYKEQWAAANLYPLLIHLRLFGKSYLRAIERTLNDFQ